MSDIRPISMTMLWLKLLESYIVSYTLCESHGNWKKNQHGGRSGSSTNHVLIEIWDRILEDLDSGQDKAVASVVCGVDFSKSFSRCSYQEIRKAYERLGGLLMGNRPTCCLPDK